MSSTHGPAHDSLRSEPPENRLDGSSFLKLRLHRIKVPKWETTIAEAHRSVWSLEKVSLCHLHVAIFGANENVFFIYCSEERGLYCIIEKARLFDSLQTSQEEALNPV